MLRNFLAVLALAVCPLFGQGVITTIAGGDWLFPGDGRPALQAPLGGNFSLDVITDKNGNYYICDTDNGVVIRVGSDGIINVIAGNGLLGRSGDGGFAVNSSLEIPSSIALDAAGNLYVGAYSTVRKVTPDGIIQTIAGTGDAGYSGDGGPAIAAKLGTAFGLAVDSAGNVFVGDYFNNVVRRIGTDGIITTVAGNGQLGFSGDKGPAIAAKLHSPTKIVVDNAGSLYIADSQNNRVRKVTNGIIDTVAGGGTDFSDNIAATSALLFPLAFTFDSAGNMYIVDGFVVGVRKVDAQGKITTIAGSEAEGFSGDGENALQATFNLSSPGIAIDSAGSILVADDQNRRIRKITADGKIQTVAGNGLYRFSGDGGPAKSATLYLPTSIVIDGAGNTFVSETFQNRIRRIAPDGTISVYAGTGDPGHSGDGGPATKARLWLPEYLRIGPDGNLYFSDSISQAIRRIDQNGNISTVVSTRLSAFGPDAARNSFPEGIDFDTAGELLFADSGTNRLLYLSQDGTTGGTFAGTGVAGFSGDGGKSSLAQLNQPVGLVYFNGAIYFCDYGNNRVRKIVVNGLTISTVAGNGQAGYSGDGGLAIQASLNNPEGLAFDGNGNLYIADTGNEVVRMVTPGGTISTFAGNVSPGPIADGLLATQSKLGSPSDVTVDAAGNVYIVESVLSRVREVLVASPSFQVSTNTLAFTAPAGSTAVIQSVNLASTIAGLPFATSSSAPWLTASPTTGTMPSTLQITVDPSQLGATTSQGTLTVTSPNAKPPVQTIAVSLTTTAAGQASLNVKPTSLTLPFVQKAPAKSRAIAVSNAGGGSLNLQLVPTTSSGGSWLTASSSSLIVGAFGSGSVNITADPTGLGPGTYSGTITISNVSPAQSVTLPVTMTVSAVSQTILIPQTGLTFFAVLGGGPTLPQFFNILNTGQGQMQWSVSASTLSGGPWLSAIPQNGLSDAASPLVPAVRLDVNPQGLNPGIYAGTVQVTAPGADNSPQFVSVFLNVLPPGSTIGPIVQPTGLIFSGTTGGESPGSQTVLVQSTTTTPLTLTTSSVTVDGKHWLTTLAGSGNLTAATPIRILVQPSIAGLATGVYHGTLTLSFSDGSVRSVAIALVLVGSGSTSNGLSLAQAQGSCTPTALTPVFTSISDSFKVPAGFPGQMSAKVVDDCANLMTTGSVIVSFSNGDPPLRLDSLKDGTWAQTWTPQHNAAQLTVTADAAIPDQGLKGEVQVTGGLLTFDSPPIIGGILNAASFALNAPVAPGSLISIFGTKLATTAAASSVPLPVILGGSSIVMAGLTMPLTYSSDGQVNAMVPYSVSTNTSQQALVTRGPSYSAPQQVTVADAAPGIFTATGTGAGQGLVFVADASGAQTLADASHPAKAGDAVVIYCTGLGQVSPAVVTGTAAPSSPLSQTVTKITATIGGVPAAVFFSGLTPPYVGLYQVNAIVPTGITPGSQVPVILTGAGQSSTPVTIAVK